MYPTGHLTSDEFWTMQRAIEDRLRAEARTFPTFALRDWSGPRVLGPWERENDVLTTVTLRHGELETELETGDDVSSPFLDVVSTTKDPARKAMSTMLAAVGLTPMSPEYRRRRQSIEDAPTRAAQVVVDGEAIRLDVRGGEDRWWAWGMHDGRGLVLEGRHTSIDDAALVSADLDPYFEGLRSSIAAARGE